MRRVVYVGHGVIIAVHTTTGRIKESQELMELVDEQQANTAIAAQTIVADCKYGTIENYIVCQKRKLRTHMADLLGSSPVAGIAPSGYEYREYKNWRGIPKPRRCPFCKHAKGEIRKLSGGA